jgi:hypothetical protein
MTLRVEREVLLGISGIAKHAPERSAPRLITSSTSPGLWDDARADRWHAAYFAKSLNC